jgi:hypothetical protein
LVAAKFIRIGQRSAAAFIPLGSPRCSLAFGPMSATAIRASFAAIAAGAALALAGCGGGDGEDLIAEDELRTCVGDAGMEIGAPDTASASRLGNVAPDFSATAADGTPIDVVVEGKPEKAERTAANVEGALLSLGVAGSEVVRSKNAIVIFEKPPGEAARAAVADCLGVGSESGLDTP